MKKSLSIMAISIPAILLAWHIDASEADDTKVPPLDMSEEYPHTARVQAMQAETKRKAVQAEAKALQIEMEAKAKALAMMTDKEKESETKRIVAELRNIPASEYKKNYQLYARLVDYNPGVEKYVKKAGFYKAKWEVNKTEIEAKERVEAEEIRLAASYPKWSYNSWEDDMTSKTVKSASVRSINTLHFNSPYAGAQKATLSLRKHPRHGKDVMLQIERGQFACHRNYKNKLLVRFDDDKAITFTCLEPDDNDSTVIFIRGYDRFVSRAKKAKKIRINRTIYRNGSPTMEFYVKGLKF